jgi:hypothetical protein
MKQMPGRRLRTLYELAPMRTPLFILDVLTLMPLTHTCAKKALKLDPPKVAPYGMKQLYLHDPVGFALCFQWRTEKTLQAEV